MRPNPNATRIDDKLIAADVLTTTKHLADAYAKYAIDSATPAVRQTLASLYMEGLSSNERVFRMMENRGWYNTNRADQQQISQIQSTFGGYGQSQYGQFQGQSQFDVSGGQVGAQTYGTAQPWYGHSNQRY